MKLELKIKNRKYIVDIARQKGQLISIRVNQEEFIFEEKETKKEDVVIAKTSLPKRDFSEKNITAPIAGTICEIFIKEKGFIKKRQKIILLTSMKMENEIISRFDGTIKEILVKNGQTVKQGDVLVRIE